MKLKLYLFALSALCFFTGNLSAQERVECWDRYELTFTHKANGNPFDVHLSAVFTANGEHKTVSGFYDGNDTYVIRFMPTAPGTWSYTTSSSASAMNRKRGSFTALPATGENHGMVVVDGEHHFKYADGTRYLPFGTTAYAWTHMAPQTQQETLKSLSEAGFNKVRMCVFPKNYNLVKDVPPLYPFELKEKTTDENGEEKFAWDFTRFDPAFFQHLEMRIDQLKELGVESDLILFHPYDNGRWGFDRMPDEVNVRYIEYITARLGAFRNVWWSMANEWNYVRHRTVEQWDMLTKTVVANDPYRHLCSIHGATAKYYDYWNPEFTHVSIQDEAPVQSALASATLCNVYRKPVILDEVGYEGNLASRWGRCSPQQMTWMIVNGVLGGAYVTHGECYQNGSDPIFWAQGGKLVGESWKQVGFLRGIVESAPNPLQMADISRDFITTTAGDGYYFVSFGKEIQEAWEFNLPAKNSDDYPKMTAGRKFKVEIIDVMAMTITPYPGTFETTGEFDYRIYDKERKRVRLPETPYLILRITEID